MLFDKSTGMSEEQFFYNEIQEWKGSATFNEMLKAEAYYDYRHDILFQGRTAIGSDGTKEAIKNVPNNHVIDNQFGRMVDQKIDYLFSKPMTIKTDDEEFHDALLPYFNMNFQLKLQRLAKEALLGGRSFIYVYYDSQGVMQFDVFSPCEVIPYWQDSMHTEMDTAVRVFEVQAWESNERVSVEKAEVFTMDGIKRFTVNKDLLIPDMDQLINSYITAKTDDDEVIPYTWERFPLVCFKYNDRETPLIRKTKSLQDGINMILSTFENNLDDDPRSCIIVLKNYGGENLGEFRHNLAAYGAIKVETVDGVAGDVDTLDVSVNADNYKVILKLFKDALVENARGYDTKDDRLSGGTLNEMNIRSIYSDLDSDANSMEAQFQASMERLLWFICQDIKNHGGKDFTNTPVQFILDRNIMLNTSEDITNCKNSVGLLSMKTILAHHPFVTDVDAEMDQIEEEKQENLDSFGFGNTDPNKTEPGNPDDTTGGEE